VRLIFATLLGRWPQRCGLSSPVLQQRVCIFGPNGYRWTQPELLRGGRVRHRGDPAIGIDSRGGRLESATKTKFAVCVCVCVCVWRKFVPNFARLPRLCVFKRRTTTVCCCGHSSANKKTNSDQLRTAGRRCSVAAAHAAATQLRRRFIRCRIISHR